MSNISGISGLPGVGMQSKIIDPNDSLQFQQRKKRKNRDRKFKRDEADRKAKILGNFERALGLRNRQRNSLLSGRPESTILG